MLPLCLWLMASSLSFPPVTDLPISSKFFPKPCQRVPTLPLHLLYSSSGHSFFGHIASSFTRKVSPSPSSLSSPPLSSPAPISDAVTEEGVEFPTSDSCQDSQNNPLTSSSSKLVLVVGGSGGVGINYFLFVPNSLKYSVMILLYWHL